MPILSDIEAILHARSVDEAWSYYIRRMAELGFPFVSYHGVRILKTNDVRMVNDSVLLSSFPARLLREIRDANLFESVPMFGWLTCNKGSESWAWMQARRLAGRVTAPEEQALELFARYGLVAGHAISLSDSVLRLRAGALISGEAGRKQKDLDRIWCKHGRRVEALTGLLHLRLATLPFSRPETVLTPRQREVLEYISIGYTTQEIASRIEVTPAMVEKHLRLARKALGARTTVQAVLLALSRRQIFLDPGEICTMAEAGHDARSGEGPEPWQFTAFPSTTPQVPGDGTEG